MHDETQNDQVTNYIVKLVYSIIQKLIDLAHYHHIVIIISLTALVVLVVRVAVISVGWAVLVVRYAVLFLLVGQLT